MQVGDVLRKKASRVVTVRMNETVAIAAQLMRANKISALVVKDVVRTECDTAVGMFTERDVVRAVGRNEQPDRNHRAPRPTVDHRRTSKMPGKVARLAPWHTSGQERPCSGGSSQLRTVPLKLATKSRAILRQLFPVRSRPLTFWYLGPASGPMHRKQRLTRSVGPADCRAVPVSNRSLCVSAVQRIRGSGFRP